MAGKAKGQGWDVGCAGEMNSGRWAAVCSRQSKRFEGADGGGLFGRWTAGRGAVPEISTASGCSSGEARSRSSEDSNRATGELVVAGRQREEGGQWDVS